MLQSITTLPLLDLSQLDGSPQQRGKFLDELRSAARHIGFFYLTGHGIDPALLSQVQQQARAFFALPDADKRAVGMLNSPHFRGYNRAASQITRGQPGLREQFEVGAELFVHGRRDRWRRPGRLGETVWLPAFH